MVCYLVNGLRKKGKNITCYDLLIKIDPKVSDFHKNTVFKSLGVICEDMMYGCTDFPDFGIKPVDMPKQIKRILDNYCPF